MKQEPLPLITVSRQVVRLNRTTSCMTAFGKGTESGVDSNTVRI
jgi:hypothetical protein